MKRLTSVQAIALLSAVALLFSGCEVIGDIFQAGMWVGIVIVVLVIAGIVWLIQKMR